MGESEVISEDSTKLLEEIFSELKELYHNKSGKNWENNKLLSLIESELSGKKSDLLRDGEEIDKIYRDKNGTIHVITTEGSVTIKTDNGDYTIFPEFDKTVDDEGIR